MFVIVFVLDGKLARSWVMLILEVAVGIAVYAILLVIFKVKVIKDAKGMLKNKR
jgi:hypothetical protein